MVAYFLAFLLGSIPFGLIIARLFHVNNLTERGSGNIGATNVSRVVGFWPAGFLTFLLDSGKGALATFLATPSGNQILEAVQSAFFRPEGSPIDSPDLLFLWTTGLLAVLGHCYSPWLHFNGGKGVATGLGVIAVLSPLAAIVGSIGFVVTFLLRRVGSLASISGVLFAATSYLIFSHSDHSSSIHLLPGAALIFIILIRHEKNIDALLDNREFEFGKQAG